MKILFLAPVPPPDHGGIINWSRLVKAEFEKRPDYELRFVDSMQRYRDVTDLSVLRRVVFGSVQAVRDILRIFHHFRCFRPDIFHLCTSGGPAMVKDAILLILARQFNIPVAIHYRMGRLPQIFDSHTMERLLTRFVLKSSAVVLVLGETSEKAVMDVVPGKYVVNLPNMVDLDEIDDARISAFTRDERIKSWNITFVGHVIPTKGIKELVRACAALREENLELHLVGPCSEIFREVLLNVAHEGRNCDNWLKFYGPVEHAEALRHIARCDLFVLPSYTEGAPNVILEAMGMGKPILATFVGAVPEMLSVDSAEPCGVCVNSRCTVSIQMVIQDFLRNPVKCRKMGQRARRRAERKYSQPVACDHLTAIWGNVSCRQNRDCIELGKLDL